MLCLVADLFQGTVRVRREVFEWVVVNTGLGIRCLCWNSPHGHSQGLTDHTHRQMWEGPEPEVISKELAPTLPPVQLPSINVRMRWVGSTHHHHRQCGKYFLVQYNHQNLIWSFLADSFQMALLTITFPLFHVFAFYFILWDNIPTCSLDIDPKRIHLLSWLFWKCLSWFLWPISWLMIWVGTW